MGAWAKPPRVRNISATGTDPLSPDQRQRWLESMIEEAVLAAFHAKEGVPEATAAAEKQVAEKDLTVPQATEEVIRAAGLEPPPPDEDRPDGT